MPRQIEKRLLAMVEGRVQQHLPRAVEAQPAAYEAEAARSRERRGYEHRRRPFPPEQVAKGAGDVYRRPREEARLGPDHTLEVLDLETGLRLSREPLRTPGERVELIPVAGERVGQIDEGSGKRQELVRRRLTDPSPPRRRADPR